MWEVGLLFLKNMLQGFKDLNMEPRYRTWTDGTNNQVYIEKYFYELKHIEFDKREISCVSNVVFSHLTFFRGIFLLR